MMRKIFTLGILLIALATTQTRAGTLARNERGLYDQPFFSETTLDLRKDLALAAGEGKNLIILIEQHGCIYCKRLHEENFSKARLVQTIAQNFRVIQLDLNGQRMLVNFDGTELPEQTLMTLWQVNATPTTLVLNSATSPATLADAEVFRLPGYLKAFYYMEALDWFASDAYLTTEFRTFLNERTAALKSEGLDPETW